MVINGDKTCENDEKTWWRLIKCIKFGRIPRSQISPKKHGFRFACSPTGISNQFKTGHFSSNLRKVQAMAGAVQKCVGRKGNVCTILWFHSLSLCRWYRLDFHVHLAITSNFSQNLLGASAIEVQVTVRIECSICFKLFGIMVPQLEPAVESVECTALITGDPGTSVTNRDRWGKVIGFATIIISQPSKRKLHDSTAVSV